MGRIATRVERVVLELESNLTTGLARDAAAVALLKRELGGLDGSNKKATSSTKALGDETDRLSTRAVKGRSEIDRLSGRLTVLAQVAAGLGPSLIPIAAVGIPAAAGLANELGGVVLGVGTAVLAFHGLGGALTALNKAALDPTVTNFKAAQLALEGLPESARAFARELSAMQPTLLRLREAAASGLFPGLEDSLNSLRTRSDDLEKILFRVGTVLGDLSRQGADALAGPEWDSFFHFISQEAPRALVGMGKAVGSVVHGLAQLWMAFAPLNDDFTGLIVRAADGFDRWATGLSKTQGFTQFIDYLRTNGPLVADAVEAIGNAVLQIVEAGAPLGGPILQAITAVANVLSTIADSPAGPTILATVTALSLLSRAQATFGKVSSVSWVQAVRGAEGYSAKISAARPALIKGGIAAAGLAVAASGIGDKFGLANTATLAMTGSLAGPWGAAAGAGVGLLLDLTKNSQSFTISSDQLTDTLNKQTGAITQNTRAYVAKQLLDQGVLRDANTLGLSLSDVTKAALGNAAAYDRVATAARALGNGNETQAEAIQHVYDALHITSAAVTDSQSDFNLLNDAVDGTSKGFGNARSAAERFRLEIDRVNDVLQHRSSLRDYQQALDDFADRAKQRGDIMVQIAQAQQDLVKANTRSERESARSRIASLEQQADALKNSLDIDTQAGRDTQAAIDAIAQSALAVAQTMKGVRQTRFLAQARDDFVKTTTDILGSKKAAEDLATKLGLVDRTHVRPKIDVQYDEAVGGIQRVQRGLDSLHDKTIHIRAVSNVHTGGTQLGLAGGGTIPGARAPYGDKVLTALAPGEEVISNRYGQADQHRALLKAINARRYADGGTVAHSRVTNTWNSASYMSQSSSGSDIDYGRLSQALLAARPLYGPVTISGDPTAFRRELQQDRQRAALGSVAPRD